MLWKLCYRHKAFIVSVGLWNRKKTEFQCLLRLEVDIDFNRNTTYSSEKEATTSLWWHTGIWFQIVSGHYADEKLIFSWKKNMNVTLNIYKLGWYNVVILFNAYIANIRNMQVTIKIKPWKSWFHFHCFSKRRPSKHFASTSLIGWCYNLLKRIDWIHLIVYQN